MCYQLYCRGSVWRVTIQHRKALFYIGCLFRVLTPRSRIRCINQSELSDLDPFAITYICTPYPAVISRGKATNDRGPKFGVLLQRKDEHGRTPFSAW